ncbi:MAG: NADP-dependent oxidoreductase [Deltaproteobacteria bacterium]|nr:NADP-dependent oxidoreductase [Deltaproteobacteria bacterium]
MRLRARPVGLPRPDDFELVETAPGELSLGEVRVRARYISLDPAMRGWMNANRSYIRPVEVGAVMRAAAIGEVVLSRHHRFQVGETVVGMLGVQELGVAHGDQLLKVDPALAPLPTLLGALGGNGLTAYFGLLDVGHPEPGETVLVSAAAGGVGSVVGQIASIVGCRAVGIAGGAAKCRHLVEDLGFDAAIDYKAPQGGDLRKAIEATCPDGIHVYFDNVGGEILDAALGQLAVGARVVVCGAISQYNAEGRVLGPSNYLNLIVKRARMEGFLTFDYQDRYAEGHAQLAQWLGEGRLRTREHVVKGIERFHEALMLLFTGDKLGKLVLELQ